MTPQTDPQQSIFERLKLGCQFLHFINALIAAWPSTSITNLWLCSFSKFRWRPKQKQKKKTLLKIGAFLLPNFRWIPKCSAECSADFVSKLFGDAETNSNLDPLILEKWIRIHSECARKRGYSRPRRSAADPLPPLKWIDLFFIFLATLNCFGNNDAKFCQDHLHKQTENNTRTCSASAYTNTD